MVGRISSPPLTVTLLAALWLCHSGCTFPESPVPQCDNGKLSLDRDLPVRALYEDCSLMDPAQRPPSIDILYDPEPASQICMSKSISYNTTIPNSGAYRPVRAESGEYLYCPPQRWVNNLHHEAVVLLYHPCAPLQERLLLSDLARACLQDYIITPYTQLDKQRPIAFVSWGRTLELSTMATSDVCVWLENTKSKRHVFGDVSQRMNYNLLLTWSAEKNREQQATLKDQKKESLRQCCELTISSLLNRVVNPEVDSQKEKKIFKHFKEEVKVRYIRASIGGRKKKTENAITQVSRFLSHKTNRTPLNRTPGILNYSSTRSLANSSLENRTVAYRRGPNEGPTELKLQNIYHSRPTSSHPLGSRTPETALKTDSSGFRNPESQGIRQILQPAAQQPSPRITGTKPMARLEIDRDAGESEHNPSARLEALAISSIEASHSTKRKEKNSAKHPGIVEAYKNQHYDKDNKADGMIKAKKVVELTESELVQWQTNNDTNSPHKGEKTGYDSVSISKPQFPPLPHVYPQPESYFPKSNDCDGCKKGEHCECTKDFLTEARAAFVNKGLLRTSGRDNAVWAASALGFLLVLLTLSVLQTRLYHHWRTMPSLYWYDPKKDYDSVADVIRRRIKIAKRRKKRGGRRECVLLPSSSSSDENLGAYRPVRAESGEYLYCPPQRWVNNLHHEAVVLLYHPCAPLQERLLLSDLARACLQDYIITPYTQLDKQRPIAFVSWGRTLELSTMATSDVCVWLENTKSKRHVFGDVSQRMNYNLLLTWSAEKNREQQATLKDQKKESLRQCCELTISSLLNRVVNPEVDSQKEKKIFKHFKEEVKVRYIRASIGGRKKKTENAITQVSRFLSHKTNRTPLNRTPGILNYSSTRSLANSSLENRTVAYRRGPNEGPTELKLQNIYHSRPTSSHPLGSRTPETALKTDSSGFRNPESQGIRQILQPAAQQPSPRITGTKPMARLEIDRDAGESEHNPSARLEALAISSIEASHSTKRKEKNSAKHPGIVEAYKNQHYDKDNKADGMIKAKKVVELTESELVQWQTNNDTNSPHKGEKTGYDSVSISKPQFPPLPHVYPQPESYFPKSNDCDGCKKGEHCECTKDFLTEARAAFVNKGLLRTSGRDNAVWAASALGFLLVLLTLSVLQTRLYHHWRTMPSLYWYDPKKDYDSVADVIRRRIKIAKRRKKRGGRRECVLLPSSSSSDENL